MTSGKNTNSLKLYRRGSLYEPLAAKDSYRESYRASYRDNGVNSHINSSLNSHNQNEHPYYAQRYRSQEPKAKDTISSNVPEKGAEVEVNEVNEVVIDEPVQAVGAVQTETKQFNKYSDQHPISIT
jgi:hypothetical protein